jgi:hypothetical protein
MQEDYELRKYSKLEESIVEKKKDENDNPEVHQIIDDLAGYLYENLNKIDDFDFRWSSLITSQPLLFEDTDYVKILPYINNTIYPFEVDKYKSGDLRKLYPNFEYMIMDNLNHFQRIIRFCTLAFCHYIRFSHESVITDKFENLPFSLDMTPTQIWCCALTSPESTKYELEYGWNISKLVKPIKEDMSYLQVNWNRLYTIRLFSMFMEASAYELNTKGFRETFIADKTNNQILSRVCKKFTNSSYAISEESFDSLFEYVKFKEEMHNELYTVIYQCLEKIFPNDNEFGIFIYDTEIFIYTTKFTLRILKNEKGQISKEYLGNTGECFAAEEYLAPTIKTQIKWADFKIPDDFKYDKDILKSLLVNMLNENYKDTICIKRMNEYGVVSKIIFKGIFSNVYVIEQYYIGNTFLTEKTKCFNKKNAANYIIERGYYISGSEKEVLELMLNEKLNKSLLVNHYCGYTILVMKYMKDVVEAYNKQCNEIIDVACNDFQINELKLNNANIKYSNIKAGKDYSITKQLMSKALRKQNKNLNSKTYWKVVNGDY